MMISRTLAIVAAIAASVGAAHAETIVTRSGEHDGFSRLVMRLPDGADWSLTQSGRTATLSIDQADAEFDTSQVFNLIPRTRIGAVSQRAPGQPLQLDLACNCDVSAYVLANGYLVVDVRGEEGELSSYTPTSNVLPLTAQGTSGYRFSVTDTEVAQSRFAMNLASAIASQGGGTQVITPQEPLKTAAAPEAAEPEDVVTAEMVEPEVVETADHRATTLPISVTSERPELPEVDTLLDSEETARAAAVAESERRLLQQIGRATNQGLLDLVMTEVRESNGNVTLDPLGTRDRPMNPLDHVSITTAIDRETGLMANQTEPTDNEQLCYANVEVSLYRWGNEKSFAEQVGALRSKLVEEFDDLNPATMLRLAKVYLYFGFGAEARVILESMKKDGGAPGNLDVLLAIADILDGKDLPINNPFLGQQVCAGDSAFWAALAEREIKKNADTDHIQQAYAKMPVHMRVHLGPRISTLFSELGEQHMAQAALRALDRSGVEHIPEINLAEAALAELEGDVETVVEELTEEVAERTENTPRALIDLINLHFDERRALSPDVPELVASYELESRDTPLGADLRKAEIVALSLEGRFDEAFKELRNLTKRDGPAARASASEPLYALLTERASDVTFLQYGLTFSENAPVAEASAVADIMARRLLDLGFASQAQSLLNKLALEDKTDLRKLMLAEAAVMMSTPERALEELSGLESSEANKLKAKAFWQLGDYDRASAVLLEEEETNEAARGFWLSENYRAISGIENAEDERFGAVASVTSAIGEIAKDPEGMPPLAEARALVESSVGTRDRIAELLSRVTETETRTE